MADNQALRQQVVLKLVQKKIVDAASQEETIKKVLAETAPALVEADRAAGLSDDEIFLKHCDAWFQAHGDEPAAPTAPKAGKTGKPAAVQLTSEEQAQLDMIINADAVAKGQRTSQSSVVAVLTDRPVMAQIYVAGSDLIPVLPEDAEAKLAKYEAELFDTPENKAAFAEAKAAWTKKEPMKVFVNPKARPKVIGFKVNTIGENNTPETRILTKEEAIIFLACEVNGIIPARDENTIGIKLRWRASRKAADVTSTASAGTSVVAVINQKLLSTNSALSECTSVITEEINDQFRAKTEKSFLLVGKKPKQDGTPSTRTMRLSGVTKAKVVKRAEQYVAKFGPVGGRKGGGQMSKAALKAQQDAVRLTIRNLGSGGMTFQSDYAKQAAANVQRALMGQSNPAQNNTFV